MPHTYKPIVALFATAPGLEKQAPIEPASVALAIGDTRAKAFLDDLGDAITEAYSSTCSADSDARNAAIERAIGHAENAIEGLRARLGE
jgi:hypothetical protein